MEATKYGSKIKRDFKENTGILLTSRSSYKGKSLTIHESGERSERVKHFTLEVQK